MADPMYVFGGNTGMTYDQLQQRRQMAEAMMMQGMSANPTTTWGGINSAAKSIVGAILDKRYGKQQQAQQASYNQQFQSAFAPQGTAATTATTPAPTDPNSPAGIGDSAMAALGQPSNNTASMITGFEGYSAKPYWDVNAYRAGYGSDTTTLPDGTVQKVQPGMTVTQDQANADLQRRLSTEFIPRVQSAVGPQVFASLPAQQQAALTSIAYNYGSLPTPVAAAVKSGDPAAVSAAIVGLSGDNGGINAHRRAAEAAAFGGQPQQGAAPQGGGDIAQMMALAASPYATPEQKAMLGYRIQQAQTQQAMAMKQSDPSYQADLGLKQAQLAQLQAGGPAPDPVKEYGFAKNQGFTGTYMDFLTAKSNATQDPALKEYSFVVQQAHDAGATPPSFNDWLLATKRAGATSVNVGADGKLGQVPPGYVLREDPSAPSGYRMMPVSGSPEDKGAAQADNASITGTVVTNAADRALAAANSRTLGGIAAPIAAMNPASPNAEVYRQVAVLKSNATIEALNAMRAQSKTGGALGNVTEKEGTMLAAKAGALDPTSPSFKRDLLDYTHTLLQVINGSDAGNQLFAQKYGDQGGQQAIPQVSQPVTQPQGLPPVPPNVDPGAWPQLWQHMSPEQKALFQ